MDSVQGLAIDSEFKIYLVASAPNYFSLYTWVIRFVFYHRDRCYSTTILQDNLFLFHAKFNFFPYFFRIFCENLNLFLEYPS